MATTNVRGSSSDSSGGGDGASPPPAYDEVTANQYDPDAELEFLRQQRREFKRDRLCLMVVGPQDSGKSFFCVRHPQKVHIYI